MADAKNHSSEEIRRTQKSIISDRDMEREEDEEEVEEDDDKDWNDWGEEGDEEEFDSNFVCLFCDSVYSSSHELFRHCCSAHKFDFEGIRKGLSLDFYGSFKLINYIRSQVAKNKCWSCGVSCESRKEMECHLHEPVNLESVKLLWDDEKYLKPFKHDDALLHSFTDDEEDFEDDYSKASVDKEEIMSILGDVGMLDIDVVNGGSTKQNGIKEHAPSSNGMSSREHVVSEADAEDSNGHLKTSIINLSAKDVKKVNEGYFGAYSSFGIHRDMISDKVRTDSYRRALVENPSLMKGAVVMDVGCGTGILSLFAAQGGASRVIAVEASEKMASVATQIAKENNLLRTESEGNSTGVMEVVQSMVEELDKSVKIEPHSLDVLVSEWMGYCLLYETMLGSVLYARDKWLKPGGAILPDTATMYVAGVGRSCTSLPFWEDVYGFNMSCVGNELVRDAARIPLVDVVQESDLVTRASVLQQFDLATMKPNDVDFTAAVELEPKESSKPTSCYGIVLWFDTGFTSRFCKEAPALLSTSPYTPKTHWCQTLLTLREPVSIAPAGHSTDSLAAVPATRLELRISIARGTEHRSIDISLEAAGIGPDGRKNRFPAQMFTMT
ncbi:Probable protein arginine N-methyltransferase 3 [Linum perenne]